MKKSPSKQIGKTRNGSSNSTPAEDPRSLEANIVAFSKTKEFRDIAGKAIAEHRAAGDSVTFIRDGLIIEQHADGREEILGKVPPPIKFHIPKNVQIIGRK